MTIISGLEALAAIAEGEEVVYLREHLSPDQVSETDWDQCNNLNINSFLKGKHTFKIKSKVKTINGYKIPLPFTPKVGQYCFILSEDLQQGYKRIIYCPGRIFTIGAWRSEEDIRQIVSFMQKTLKQ